VLLLHAILPTEAAAPPDAGLRGWPLRVVHANGLSAWATECVEQPFSPRRDDLLAQHALLEQALGVCLPVRFPTWLPDKHAVRDLLQQRRAALLAALERVRGRVELAVTVTWDQQPLAAPTAVVATSPGRRFLEQRGRQYAQADQRRAEAQRLAMLLETDDRVLEAQHSLCPSDQIGLSSALLVEEADALAVAKRFRDLRQGVRILVNGPWPPYTFASLEE
jgi:Gas vesicle synthesis protein GvpL/GvpF